MSKNQNRFWWFLFAMCIRYIMLISINSMELYSSASVSQNMWFTNSVFTDVNIWWKQPVRLLCVPICLFHVYVLNTLQFLKRHLGIYIQAFSILYKCSNGKQSWNKVWEGWEGRVLCNLSSLVKALWLCLGLSVTVFYSCDGTPPNHILNQAVPKLQPSESCRSLFSFYIF